jgi:hypothetical protein
MRQGTRPALRTSKPTVRPPRRPEATAPPEAHQTRATATPIRSSRTRTFPPRPDGPAPKRSHRPPRSSARPERGAGAPRPGPASGGRGDPATTAATSMGPAAGPRDGDRSVRGPGARVRLPPPSTRPERSRRPSGHVRWRSLRSCRRVRRGVDGRTWRRAYTHAVTDDPDRPATGRAATLSHACRHARVLLDSTRARAPARVRAEHSMRPSPTSPASRPVRRRVPRTS